MYLVGILPIRLKPVGRENFGKISQNKPDNFIVSCGKLSGAEFWVLNNHLKALMKLGIVEKEGDTYELSGRGKQLVRILKQLYSVF